MALVVLLRGLNVGGHRTFRPTQLAEQLQHLDVVNIGATGTFVVRQRVSRAALRAEFNRRLPFEAEIIICQGREIIGLMSKDFFADCPMRPDITRFVSVLSRPPRMTPPLPMNFPSSDGWLVKILERDTRFVVGLYRRNMKVISYLGMLDRAFGVPLTTRSWSTITAVAKVLDAKRRPSVSHGSEPSTMPSSSWKKSPPDLIETFAAALPGHPDLVRKPMFGYPAAFVNGNMVCGLFQDSVVVRLGKEQASEAVANGTAVQFAPMPGRTMTGYVLVPAADTQDPTSLSSWLTRALNYTLTLPRKAATKKVAKSVSAKGKARGA